MLEELFNPTSKGGLGILDVRNKANALFMKQLSRMLTRKEEGSYHHLCYWLGSHLQQRLPDMLDRGPVLQRPPPPFHQHTLTLPQEGFQWFGVDPSKLRDITAKKLYKEYTSDISEPKIPSMFLQVNFPSDVWPRLSYSQLSPGARQSVFNSIHCTV